MIFPCSFGGWLVLLRNFRRVRKAARFPASSAQSDNFATYSITEIVIRPPSEPIVRPGGV